MCLYNEQSHNFSRLTNNYPPCIIHILDCLKDGKEISNAAKVLLSTYELANGKTVSDIAKMVGGGGLRVKTYQIDHLGLKGSSIVYPVPTCYKALRQNLCYATDECAGIKSPLEFGKQK
jgi:DNA primase large subunit